MAMPLKVLLLEDRPADAKLILQALGEAGYEPEAHRVDNEADFMAALNPAVEVIFADCILPDWSGEAAIAAVQRSGLEVPVIVVSGVIGDEKAAAVMQLGAADFLLKDRLARLGPAVAHALAERHLRCERRTAQEALRTAHTQLAQLIEHSPAVLYQLKLASDRFVPQVVGESIARLLGFTAAETVDFEWWTGRLHPEDRERALNSLPETLTAGTSRTEYRLRHKAGHYCWIEDLRRVIRDEAGKAVELVGAWIDITERKAVEAERERLLAELQAARAKVKVLTGFLPICASCKKIRDTQGVWQQLEAYIHSHSEADFTHGLCPDCAPKCFPKLQHPGSPARRG